MEGIPLVIDELSLHTVAYTDELGLQVPNKSVHSRPLNLLFHPGKQFAEEGFCIGSEAQKRFADVTIICTIYIQMFFKKIQLPNLPMVTVCKSGNLSPFYRLKSNYTLHFSHLQNIRLRCLNDLCL